MESLPTIELPVGDKKALFMLDSGASGNLITQEGLALFKEKTLSLDELQPLA